MPVGLCTEYLRLFVAKSREDRKGDLSLPQGSQWSPPTKRRPVSTLRKELVGQEKLSREQVIELAKLK